MKTFLVIILQMLVVSAYCQVDQQWVQRFTSDSVRNDGVNDMYVDAGGNVYVTGYQKQTGINNNVMEAVTVKYNSQGVQQWIQNFHAPLDNGAFGRAIYVDAGGNVYVTGENAIVSGGGNEMLVIKYSPGGTQLWAKTYHYTGNMAYTGGFDLVTDASGNVFVCGEYYTGATFLNNLLIVKFDGSTGQVIGQTFFNAGSEGARKIALDGNGKVIVAGYADVQDTVRYIVLKYEPELSLNLPVWFTYYTPPMNSSNTSMNDMVIDNNSNIILAGNDHLDFGTVKFDNDGNILWVRTYNSPMGWDVCRSVVCDNLGNVYVTGESGTTGFPTSYDITTIKYDPNGNQVWLRSYDGFSNNTDGYRGYDIAIDDASNIYVTGAEYGAGNIATVKYSSNGSFQWGKTYNGTGNGPDNPVAVGVDQNGNAYACGTSLGDTTGYDIAIIKYAPSSNFGVQFKKNSLGKPINDLASTRDTISIEYSSLLNYNVVDVNLNIDSVLHPNTDDLEFYLIHNGLTDTTIYRVGGSGDNFIGTVLNDSASNSISTGSAPFSGQYKPSSPLSRFNNVSINGDWILLVYDRASGNTGTLNAWSLDFVVDVTSGIQAIGSDIPDDFKLYQNYPNPFNPSTKLKFEMPISSFVKLAVYDITGRQIAQLVNKNLESGQYEYSFDGSRLASGVYFYKITTDAFSETRRMVLVK